MIPQCPLPIRQSFRVLLLFCLLPFFNHSGHPPRLERQPWSLGVVWLSVASLGKASVSRGGYYVKLLEVPSICPFNDFCLPWVPKWSQVFGWEDASDEAVLLLNNTMFSIALRDFSLVKWWGGLKSTHHCYSALRADSQARMWHNSPDQLQAWCKMSPDTLRVTCGAQKLCPSRGCTKDSVPFGKLSRSSPMRHLYIVPLSCVDYRSSFRTQRVFSHRVEISINPILSSSSSIHFSFAPNLIEVEREDYFALASKGGRHFMNATSEARIKDRFTWERGHKVEFKPQPNSHDQDGLEATLTWAGIFQLVVRQRLDSASLVPSLDLVLHYLNPLWMDNTLPFGETGILAKTGFLSIMTPSLLVGVPQSSSHPETNRAQAIQSCLHQRSLMGGLHPEEEIRQSNVHLLANSTQVPVAASCQCSNLTWDEIQGRLTSDWVRGPPKATSLDDLSGVLLREFLDGRQLWRQACCSTLLGKIQVLANFQRRQAGSSNEISNHFVHFNKRQACAIGSQPLDLQGQCPSTHCCQRNQFEIAKWDHRTRGKCWVLRLPNGKGRLKSISASAEKTSGDKSRSQYRVQSAAFGIMAIATIFVLTFRFVSRKLEECRPITIR